MVFVFTVEMCYSENFFNSEKHGIGNRIYVLKVTISEVIIKIEQESEPQGRRCHA